MTDGADPGRLLHRRRHPTGVVCNRGIWSWLMGFTTAAPHTPRPTPSGAPGSKSSTHTRKSSSRRRHQEANPRGCITKTKPLNKFGNPHTHTHTRARARTCTEPVSAWGSVRLLGQRNRKIQHVMEGPLRSEIHLRKGVTRACPAAPVARGRVHGPSCARWRPFHEGDHFLCSPRASFEGGHWAFQVLDAAHDGEGGYGSWVWAGLTAPPPPTPPQPCASRCNGKILPSESRRVLGGPACPDCWWGAPPAGRPPCDAQGGGGPPGKT